MAQQFGNDPIQAAAAAIRAEWSQTPLAGVILGTGLGAVAERIDVEVQFDATSLPGFRKTTAMGHPGRLACGRIAGVPVLAMVGRLHCYEGYSIEEITLPVRVMKLLGVKLLIVTNAAGGLNPLIAAGDWMVIHDHINLLNRKPHCGGSDDGTSEEPLGSGTSATAVSLPYDERLGDRAAEIARREKITCHRGVYVAMLGPNYETRAEVRMLRHIGGDAVGMSTVPEVIVAARAGLRVLGLSVITNVCSPDIPRPTTGSQVAATAAAAEQNLWKIIAGMLTSEA